MLDAIDFILFPLYVFLFYLIFSVFTRKIEDPVLKKYLKRVFVIKVFAVLLFTLYQVYIGGGDSIGYFIQGNDLHNAILKDPTNIKWMFDKGENFDASLLTYPQNINYLKSEAYFLVTKISALFCFVGFGKYLLVNLIFSMLLITGIWRLYLFFYQQYPALHKEFAIAIFYIPSFVFWSSGASKEVPCIAALGFITYGLYEILKKRKNLVINSFLIVVFSYMLYVIKSYIFVSYIPFLILFMVSKKIKAIKSGPAKVALVGGILIIAFTGSLLLVISEKNRILDEGTQELVENVQLNQHLYEMQAEIGESNFSLGAEFDGTITGMLKIAPLAFVATMYRPFIWEAKKATSLISSLESLLMLFITLYAISKVGVFGFFRSIYKNPLVLFCILFAAVFAVFVGASTLNFGSLIRYKIPCLPFYVIAMYVVLYEAKKKKKPVIAAVAA